VNKTNRKYRQLSIEERSQLEADRRQGLRASARKLGRAPSTLSREVRRHHGAYLGGVAQQRASQRVRRGTRKLKPDTALFATVSDWLRKRWSPQQIAAKLKAMHPHDPAQRASHETIYSALYALPKGELRATLLKALRQSKRRPRSRGTDRRGVIPNMTPISLRPPEVAARQVPGHWEGDLIKGRYNRSAIGTLVERKLRYVVPVKLDGTDAQSALAGFTRRFQAIPPLLRRSLTYDQGKELALHDTLARRLQLSIYFADPHSPWQRGTNENTNGLLRQYFPKGTDLSGFTQAQLDAVADELNDRPRRTLNWLSPAEAFQAIISQLTNCVALHI
jgi:IS30 family transposase